MKNGVLEAASQDGPEVLNGDGNPCNGYRTLPSFASRDFHVSDALLSRRSHGESRPLSSLARR